MKSFSATFYMGDNLSNILFAFLHITSLQKGVYSKRNEFVPSESTPPFLEQNPFHLKKSVKQFWQIYSPPPPPPTSQTPWKYIYYPKWQDGESGFRLNDGFFTIQAVSEDWCLIITVFGRPVMGKL